MEWHGRNAYKRPVWSGFVSSHSDYAKGCCHRFHNSSGPGKREHWFTTLYAIWMPNFDATYVGDSHPDCTQESGKGSGFMDILRFIPSLLMGGFLHNISFAWVLLEPHWTLRNHQTSWRFWFWAIFINEWARCRWFTVVPIGLPYLEEKQIELKNFIHQ